MFSLQPPIPLLFPGRSSYSQIVAQMALSQEFRTLITSIQRTRLTLLSRLFTVTYYSSSSTSRYELYVSLQQEHTHAQGKDYGGGKGERREREREDAEKMQREQNFHV